jgi:hypothetical protein
MTEGSTKTIQGLKIYVQDVFVSTVGGESASARLFVGSRELNLGNSYDNGTAWTDVQLDNEDMDGVEVSVYGVPTGVSQIDFRINPTEMANEDTNEDWDWLALGDTFVGPLFGFELSFVEAVPDFMSKSRDYVRFKSSNDDLDVTFTNADGVEYTFSPYSYDAASTANITLGEDFYLNITADTAVSKDAMFILEESSSSSEPVSRIFEFTGSDLSDDEATFKDVGSGQVLTVGSGDALGKTSVTVTINADDVINLSAATKYNVYTASGANVSFFPLSNNVTKTTKVITVTEDAKGVNTDEVAGDVYTIDITYDTTDDEINIAKPASWDGASDDDDDGDYFYGLGEYGAYYMHESDENTELELWIPSEDTDYRLFLAPGASQVVTVGGDDGDTYYNVNSVGVGVAIQDKDAPALGSTPMIVVGGPCANTVAAELMGNPANCVEGFEKGKAVIRWYEDESAILVAGYSATDTVGASRVLADYADWDLDGSEVEVVVPSLSGISVNQV